MMASGSLWAQSLGNIGVATGNLSLTSTNAMDTSNDVNISSATAFDGILNSAGTNGAVFDLAEGTATTFNVDVSNVGNLTALNLFQTVGNASDNGIQDFTVTFFDGDNQSGSVLLSETFSAALTPGNTSETFALSSSVINPESFSLDVISSFGNQAFAEFSEVTFDGATGLGSVVAVPEPSSAVVGLLAAAWVGFRRRRK